MRIDILRPGNIYSSKDTEKELDSMLHFLSEYFEKIIFKADSAYATPAIFGILHNHINYKVSKIEYFIKAKRQISWIDNSAPFVEFKDKTYSVMNLPMEYFRETENGKTVLKDRYFSFSHQCFTWKHEEKIVARVRYTDMDQQSMFEAANKEVTLVITNTAIADDSIFDEYGSRAKCERSIEEVKNESFAGTLSSRSFTSNGCMFLLKCISHNLMQLIRLNALKGTGYSRARTSTIRRILFKIGGKIVKTARYIYLKLSGCFAYKNVFVKAFRQIQIMQFRL